MSNPNLVRRDLIEGKPALIVIDIQKGTFINNDDVRAIDHMPDYRDRMTLARTAIDKARECGVPIIFIQEAHRPDHIDFGRELGGDEDVHCVEGAPGTPLAVVEMGITEADDKIVKRRYSAFFGTDFEILLRGLKAETLLLVGGLTDVCVHYTFADAHQSDYFTRVIEDCVAGSSLEAHEASLRAMEYLQAGARRSLDEVLAAMESYKGRAAA